jgi:hypothetical protein
MSWVVLAPVKRSLQTVDLPDRPGPGAVPGPPSSANAVAGIATEAIPRPVISAPALGAFRLLTCGCSGVLALSFSLRHSSAPVPGRRSRWDEHRGRHGIASLACLAQAANMAAFRCADRARSTRTATVAASSAAAAAIRAICHPGMPPTTTVRVTV